MLMFLKPRLPSAPMGELECRYDLRGDAALMCEVLGLRMMFCDECASASKGPSALSKASSTEES